MAANEVKTDRHYSKDHEWAKREGDRVLVGITAFAVDQLGDITLVNIDVKAGDTITLGKAFGTIESVKTLSDLFAPISGKSPASIRRWKASPSWSTTIAMAKPGWSKSSPRIPMNSKACSTPALIQNF